MKSRLLVKLDILHDVMLEDRADEVVETALDYLLSYERKKLEKELLLTEKQVASFRGRFSMDDREFMRKYESSALEDKPEFLEWFALLSLESSLKQRFILVSKALELVSFV